MGLDIFTDFRETIDLMDFDTSKLQPSGMTAIGPYDPLLFMSSFNYINSDTWPLNDTSIATMPPHPMQRITRTCGYKGSAAVTAKMMRRLLTAYPGMMSNRGPPPPFLHVSFLAGAVTTFRKPLESLATCESLMQLLSSSDSNEASRRLVWKNVRLECERVHAQYMLMDRWELMSSMQALLIYTLLRLEEGQTADNNIDAALLSAMWVCSLPPPQSGSQLTDSAGCSIRTKPQDRQLRMQLPLALRSR